MSDLQLIGTVLGAATFGAVITAVVQLIAALRMQSREVADASRRVAELAELLKPLAGRLGRLGELVEASEQDLQRVQQSVHRISEGSVEFAENFARISGWVGLAAPLLMAAIEGWAGRTPAQAPKGGPHADPVGPHEDDTSDNGHFAPSNHNREQTQKETRHPHEQDSPAAGGGRQRR